LASPEFKGYANTWQVCFDQETGDSARDPAMLWVAFPQISEGKGLVVARRAADSFPLDFMVVVEGWLSIG
jgi:hypothetical protein